MTADDILPILQRWHDVITGLDEAIDALDEVVGCNPESRLHAAANAAHGLANDWAADRIGTAADWLEWHWLENRMGERSFECSVNGVQYRVRSLEDFAKALAADLAAARAEAE